MSKPKPGLSEMQSPLLPSPVLAHRARQRDRGVTRTEVAVAAADAPLIRAVAAALTDPDRAPAARALLRASFAAPQRDFKALLAAAPCLDDLDLARARDTGRNVDL